MTAREPVRHREHPAGPRHRSEQPAWLWWSPPPRDAGWTGALLLALGVVLGLGLRAHDGGAPLALDTWFAGRAAGWSEIPGAVGVARVFNVLGGGVFAVLILPVLVLIVLVLRRRGWAALTFVLASVASAAVVQIVKAVVDRDRPLEMLVTSDHGSFPSGHTANAATLLVLAWLLSRRWWVAVLGCFYVAAMGFSRALLSVHWLTDLVGGALLGAGVALMTVALVAVVRERMVHRIGPAAIPPAAIQPPVTDRTGVDQPGD